MKKLIFVLFLVGTAALAQVVPTGIAPLTNPPPFDPTPVVATLSTQSAYTQSVTVAVNALITAQAADAAKLAVLSDQSAAIAALKSQLAADEARIVALEAKVFAAGTALAKP